MNDTELVQQYLAGDLSAFNRLVRQWEQPIFNFTWRMCGDFEEAKDLTQKTFIRVYKNLRRLKDHQKFKTWLYQIAANLCRDEIRRTQRRQMISVNKLQDDYENGSTLPDSLVSASENSPEFDCNHHQIQAMLEAALKKIPDEQRIVVVMKEYQGLKFIEIAEILNQSVNTIKSRMYYGLNALRKIFAQWDIKKEALEYDM